MYHMNRKLLILLGVFVLLLLPAAAMSADECADGDIDACWTRYYAGGETDESKVYFRIFRACQGGLRIGIAANMVDSYEFYVKQYGSGQSPAFRLLTEPTTVNLTHYPAGVNIEWTS